MADVFSAGGWEGELGGGWIAERLPGGGRGRVGGNCGLFWLQTFFGLVGWLGLISRLLIVCLGDHSLENEFRVSGKAAGVVVVRVERSI